jgi:4-alpha-glucanotransferase
VPPDSFSRTGQLWGHPHYRWSEHRRTRFAWWVARVKHALTRFDGVRIDHFVGFVNAYEIPGRARTAMRGVWRKAPGAQLLTALERNCGKLPLIAEDLGQVTPAVTALRERFGLPGMRIVQYAFGDPRSENLPCKHPVNCVTYPGTHDNPTTVEWWHGLDGRARERFCTYAGGGLGGAGGARKPAAAQRACHDMVRITLQSPATLAVVPVQDLLGLGRSARMNTPGRPSGQWRWRLERGALAHLDPVRIRGLAEACARA